MRVFSQISPYYLVRLTMVHRKGPSSPDKCLKQDLTLLGILFIYLLLLFYPLRVVLFLIINILKFYPWGRGSSPQKYLKMLLYDTSF